MAESEKDRVARQVADLRVAFDLALSDKRKYPVREFDAFLRSARHYIEITAGGSTIHKSVAWAVNGLLEFPQAEKKRIPGNVLFEADPELPPGRLVYPWRLPRIYLACLSTFRVADQQGTGAGTQATNA